MNDFQQTLPAGMAGYPPTLVPQGLIGDMIGHLDVGDPMRSGFGLPDALAVVGCSRSRGRCTRRARR
jgi:hypothetical protein